MANQDLATFKANAKKMKAFKESAEGQRLLAIAVAMFRHVYTRALLDRWRRRQGSWKPLSAKYVIWKIQKPKRHREIWKNTGKTLRAISDNAPYELGTKKGLRMGLNWRRAFAFTFPNTLRVKGAKGRQARAVYARMNWGHRGRDVRIRQKSRKGKVYFYRRPAEPGRELFEWDREDMPQMVKDVEKALEKAFRDVGLGD